MTIGVDGNEANVKERVGSGQYAFELLKEFAKEKSYNFVIYLKDQPSPDLPKETANFKYKVFGPQKFWTQFALPISLTFGLSRGTRGSRPDVFFSMAHYGPRFARVPYVVTIHDLSYLHYPGLFKKGDLYQLRNWSKYSIKKSTHIIAVSQSTKDDIVKNYNVSPDKITVTYEGYDLRFRPQSQAAVNKIKKKYKIAGDYIIVVGTLQPRKNLERLIEAYSSLESFTLPRASGNLKLVIVGKKGWLYDSIFTKVNDFGLEGKVVFTDYVPDGDLPTLISGARFYVLPSLWEGFGIPVIEAQACHVPVVVSNTSSLPEIVGDSGVLVDPESVESIASGIKKVLTDQKLAGELVERGTQNIKRFSWQNCARETIKVLEKSANKI